MSTKLNLTSLTLGAVLGALAILTIGASSTSPQTGSGGRFQLLAAEGALFKIDTTTGQVWRSYISSPSGDFMKQNVTP